MTVHLQTRGRPRHRDYAFLGGGPEQPWWRAYAEHTAFERPTVLVEADAAGYRAYLSGIPSARRDAVGTVIRYTVVLDATAEDADLPPEAVLALVSCWLADQAADGCAGAVSRALDAQFPEEEVERLLGATEPAAPAEVRRRVAAAVESLAGPGAGSADRDAPRSWMGDAGAQPARAAFVARVAELVHGTPGRALLLNLVGSADDLRGLLVDGADDGPIAVLAPELGTTWLIDLGRDQGAPLGKAPPSAAMAPPRTAAPSPRIPSPRALAPLMLLAAVTVAVLVPLILLVIPIVALLSR